MLSKTESLPKKKTCINISKKLITPKNDISENSSTFSNMIIDLDIITRHYYSLIGTCPECESENLRFDIDHSEKKGLSCCLKLKCKNCHIWSKEMYNVHK